MTNEKNNIDVTIQYDATGVSNTFQYPFLTFEDSDVDVYVDGKLIKTGYQFVADAGRLTGNAIFDIAPEVGKKITLSRTLAFDPVVDFQESGTFRASVLNLALLRLLAYCQELFSRSERSMQLPPYENKIDITLPTPINGHAVVWAKDGSGLVNSKYPADDALDVSITKADAAAASATAAAFSENEAARSRGSAAVSAKFAAETVDGFDKHAGMKQADFDTNAKNQKDNFDNNAQNKTTELIQTFNDNAAEKQTAVDLSAGNAAASEKNALKYRDEAKQFRDEAEEITNFPEMSETVKGAAMAATAEEVIAGMIDNKSVTPKKLKIHTGDVENPHNVTATQVGLGNVDNTADLDKPVSEPAKQYLSDAYKEKNHEKQRNIVANGAVNLPLLNVDEIIVLEVQGNTTVTIDQSLLDLQGSYTVQLLFWFPNGEKTIAIVPPTGQTLKYVNNFVPNFLDAKFHWVVLRKRAADFWLISDAGTEG